MPQPLNVILQFERWLEEGFREILASVAPNVYTSRDIKTANSPRITILANIIGLASMHVHPTTGGNSIYDAFEGEIEVEVETNRATEAKSNAHYELLGGVRAAMIDYLAQGAWNQSNPLRITDIRPQEAPHTVDEDNLDSTKLSFYIVFNVNPSQWPDNL
jgi:hypothetical protein